MWNLETRYRWTYVQSRNSDADMENKHRDSTRGRRGLTWETETDIYKVFIVRIK